MAQAIEELAPRSFSEWFSTLCARADVTPKAVHRAIILSGGDVSYQAVYDWMRGANEPSASKLFMLIRALDTLRPDLVVWESLQNFYMSYSISPRKKVRRSRAIQHPLVAAVKA